MTAEPPAPGRRCLFGVNLPVFFGAYGHDMAPNERHPTWGARLRTMDAYEPLLVARELGFEAVRVALCEGAEGVVTRDGAIAGAHPDLLENLRVVQECARLAGLRVYWTLLDGNSVRRDGDALTGAAVLDAAQSARFGEHVAAAVARALDPGVALGLELLSSPETLVESARDWASVRAFLRAAGDAVRAERPGLAVTAGAAPGAVGALFDEGCGLAAVDVHVHAGELPATRDLAAPAALPRIAGELGAGDEDEASRSGALAGLLRAAERAGYDAAFAWRLDRVLTEGRGRERALTEAGRAVREALAAR